MIRNCEVWLSSIEQKSLDSKLISFASLEVRWQGREFEEEEREEEEEVEEELVCSVCKEVNVTIMDKL